MRAGPYLDLLNAAISYGKRGWRVFPVHTVAGEGCSCYLHRNCSKVAKHPAVSGWRQKATTDETTIRNWWTKRRGLNVGIVTGAVSDLVVIDVDDKNGKRGTETLLELTRQHGGHFRTLSATTGSGKHLYFRNPGVPIKTRVQALGEGLDVKADGGYVVAPPSMHASGNDYRWDDPETEVEVLPEWLVERVTTEPVRQIESSATTIQALLQRASERIPEGMRNETLFRRGCAMRGAGYSAMLIEAELRRINSVYCDPPLPQNEIRQIAAAAARYTVGKQDVLATFVRNRRTYEVKQ